jgi:hypothetical protein
MKVSSFPRVIIAPDLLCVNSKTGRQRHPYASQIPMPWRWIHCLINHHATNTYWGSRDKAPRILKLGTKWRWMVSFTLRPLGRRRKDPGNRWIIGWVGPRVGLDAATKRKNPCPCRELNHNRPARSLVTILTGLPRLNTLHRDVHYVFLCRYFVKYELLRCSNKSCWL